MGAGRDAADSATNAKFLHPFPEAPMNESSPQFQLRFTSLFDPGRGWAFPCDSQGHVDMDHMTEAARNNYLYARAMIGREVATPAVCLAH